MRLCIIRPGQVSLCAYKPLLKSSIEKSRSRQGVRAAFFFVFHTILIRTSQSSLTHAYFLVLNGISYLCLQNANIGYNNTESKQLPGPKLHFHNKIALITYELKGAIPVERPLLHSLNPQISAICVPDQGLVISRLSMFINVETFFLNPLGYPYSDGLFQHNENQESQAYGPGGYGCYANEL